MCEFITVQELLGKKWTLEILQALHHTGDASFNSLVQSLRQATNRIIAKRLQHLIKHNIVSKRILSEMPLRVSYALTLKGTELVALLDGLKEWGVRFSGLPQNCTENNCCGCTLNTKSCAKYAGLLPS